MERLENFSRIMKTLLSGDNKDKLLGEISDDLEDAIIQVKNMIDSGEITHHELQQEISKNLNLGENHVPGSVAQMIIGCTKEDSCPMRQEELMDIPYFYDQREDSLIPITKIDMPIGAQSYAVVYMTGGKKLTPKVIAQLQNSGFTKAKVMFKNSTHDKYKMSIYENLNQSPVEADGNFNTMAISIGLFILFTGILMFYLFRAKDLRSN